MTRRRLPPEQRRLEVIKAAEEVLRHNASARVEDIVAAAGAAKGTFYTYFPSWDDLLEVVRERETERTLQHVSPAFGLAQTGQWTAVLPTLAEGFIKAVLAMQGLHGALFHSPFTVAR